jgi:hypothetical protein
MVDIVPIEQIVSKIYWLRSVKVMLDRDLAELYEVETRILKRNVRRHIKRFPDDFMFELSYQEFASLRSQIGTSNRGGTRYMPMAFTEQGVAMHADKMRQLTAVYLFESNWKRQYTDRGVRKLLEKYVERAGIKRSISPHRLRHFLLTWLKKQGIDDSFIQPYSGHSTRQSLEVYSKLSIKEAQKEYDRVIDRFPV